MTEDTIAAIATPIGQAGIGVIRISGDNSLDIAGRIFRPYRASERGAEQRQPARREASPINFPSHTVHHGYTVDPVSDEPIDEVLLTVFVAPKSYTGENVVEISCHGGIAILRRVLESTLSAGARHAEPGEFTKRAFLNGRIDLAQAEAVNDLIRARTDEARALALRQLEGGLSGEIRDINSELGRLLAEIEASIDFPDDVEEPPTGDLRSRVALLTARIQELLATADRGRIYREGIVVAIAGRPNVGKSSLLNALLRESRAIVTEVPGTTRDTIEETVSIRGVPVVAIDTAGLRETRDAVEQIGVQRAEETIQRAQVVLFVVDATEGFTEEDAARFSALGAKPRLIVLNKRDLLPDSDAPRAADRVAAALPDSRVVAVSALTGAGIAELEDRIAEMVFAGAVAGSQSVLVSNVRHKQAIERSLRSLESAIRTVDEARPVDLLSVDLMAARGALGEITGETAAEDLIDRIFSEFCIGK
ncbi:MAG: tRNA uridine-5-carboxymethylaminomethyl(34) synthesis GTPase MnmE [Armatimonadota bacterium]|nr:tRNA uridine-5-carboxymethylaminomethyl(34) synthesis GTPase MnmE [Armatimonadota bacterium]